MREYLKYYILLFTKILTHSLEMGNSSLYNCCIGGEKTLLCYKVICLLPLLFTRHALVL